MCCTFRKKLPIYYCFKTFYLSIVLSAPLDTTSIVIKLGPNWSVQPVSRADNQFGLHKGSDLHKNRHELINSADFWKNRWPGGPPIHTKQSHEKKKKGKDSRSLPPPMSSRALPHEREKCYAPLLQIYCNRDMPLALNLKCCIVRKNGCVLISGCAMLPTQHCVPLPASCTIIASPRPQWGGAMNMCVCVCEREREKERERDELRSLRAGYCLCGAETW